VRVLLLVALALAVSPSAASAFNKAIWGQVTRGGVNQFPIYKQLGVSIYEDSLNWATVAPTRPASPTNPNDPAYQWPPDIQQAVQQAQHYHMRILIQLIDSPGWANGGHPANWVPNFSDFANFATAAARKWPSIHLWMIWGEPNREGLFAPMYGAKPNTQLNRKQQIAPHNYARVLDAAYGALKRVNRRNTVIGGSTYTTGLIDTQQWIQNMKLPNGHRPRMDMYAQNPFTFREPTTLSGPPSPLGAVEFPDLDRLGHWVDQYLRRGMPLFFSEWTIPTCPDQEFNGYVDPPAAARWVKEALHLLRHWKRAYGLGWIHVYDQPPVSCGGLLTVGGQKKAIFNAFARG
jgi:hypothetical protein